MTRVPTRQLYPPTATNHLQLFRYSSSNPLKTPFLSKGFCSESKLNHIPFVKPNSFFKIKCSAGGLSHLKNPSLSSTNSTTWLGKWNQINKNNTPKTLRAARDYRGSESDFDSENGFDSGTGTVRISGGSTMERIVEKLKKFGYVDDVNVNENESENDRGNERKIKRENEARVIEKGSVEDIFYVEDGLLPNPRGGFSPESPLGVESLFGDEREVRFPWEKGGQKIEEKFSVREKSRTNMAELTLPESELRRLRNLAHGIKSKMRIKGGGVTHTVVEMIHEKWKSAEVVRLKIEGAPALNMKLVHEILERKTDGLVIWRSGTSISLYRGVSFESPSGQAGKNKLNKMAKVTKRPIKSEYVPERYLESGEEIEEREPGKVVSYEDEIDKLLDGLGERYTDWPGGDPLPVDGDLLPGIVAGYQPPFRILPYGVRGTLSVKEATDLRRLARVLPPHFALGRSRQHHGLAAAMIKLWERSSIAKIAIKRGVQLTTSERMAEDIKKLTGGMLLSRNKYFLVFYRGKNFLSPEVSEALLEKERLAKSLQDEEEQARLRASPSMLPNSRNTTDSQRAGTLEETLEANARWAKTLDNNDKVKVLREADVLRHTNLVRKLESKLAFADRKLIKAQRNLSKVEESLSPVDRQSDPDSISDEERFMFRKLGLRMKAFLLLGRRGVFGGTVENMHLHWKYRELVKIIVKAANFEEVKNIALSLESESGGVLVSVDRVSKGYAIIVYRGRDYHRPSALRPKNLLTKRKALARSIELQRSEDLHNHISTLETRVAKLRHEIDQMSTMRGSGNVELYDELDSAYSTEDDDSEEEEYGVYDDPDSDGEEESDHMIHNTDHLETSFVYDLQDHGLEEPGDCSTYASANES